jgi:hypothetical protein
VLGGIRNVYVYADCSRIFAAQALSRRVGRTLQCGTAGAFPLWPMKVGTIAGHSGTKTDVQLVSFDLCPA